jgi:hypothetical protein
MRVNELALSQAVLSSLAKVGIHQVEQLAEHRTGELLRRPEFTSGVELYELICELHRHGLTPLSGHGGHIETERELEIFCLRAVEGLTFTEIGERVRLNRTRVDQLLRLHFPSTKCRQPPNSGGEHAMTDRPLQETHPSADDGLILVIEANADLGRSLVEQLLADGHPADLARTAGHAERAVSLAGRRVELRRLEYELLLHLARDPQRCSTSTSY